MKYGILGCGKHALQSHAIPGRDLEELELIAICDISEEQLALFERTYGRTLAKFTDKQKFLHSGINAVLIGTPDECHYRDLVSVVEAGLPAFVEKPLGVTSTEVKDLEKLLGYASSRGLVISSCHPRRYDPPFRWLKENLSRFKDELGAPIEFRFDFSYHKPSKSWKHTRGLLLDHANHEIDLLHYLFGPKAFQATKLIDGFDQYQIVGIRKDGIRFSFAGTRRLESRTYLEWANIRFEKGEMGLDAHQGLVRINYHDKDGIEEIKIQPTDYKLRGRETMFNFARTIGGKESCYLSASDLYVNTALSVMLTEHKNWTYKGRNNISFTKDLHNKFKE